MVRSMQWLRQGSRGLLLGLLLTGCGGGRDAAVTPPTPTPAPAATPSALPTPPSLSEVDRQTVISTVLSQAETLNLCEGSWTPETANQLSVVYPLDAANYLVEITCFMAAYQANYAYVLYQPGATAEPEAQVKLLRLQDFTATSDGTYEAITALTLAGLSTYDPVTQNLTIFTKYRGIGDCGALATYEWTGEDLMLASFRAKSACDGQFTEPSAYAQIYPAPATPLPNASAAPVNPAPAAMPTASPLSPEPISPAERDRG